MSGTVPEDVPQPGRERPPSARSPPHLPVSGLEGQEDLLPLPVGATPQAVDDGLLIGPWGKTR